MSPAELAMRRRHDRWAAKGRARVALPGRKAVVVPCASPFAAIQCAAELFDADDRIALLQFFQHRIPSAQTAGIPTQT